MNFSHNIDSICAAIRSAQHPTLTHPAHLRLASVMAIFIPPKHAGMDTESCPDLLFIQKADTKGYPWRNQMAFPGGIQDPQDPTSLDTAFREVTEELAISRDQLEPIGFLGDYRTTQDTIIQGFSAIWTKKSAIDFDTSEISRVITIPLAELMAWHEKQDYHRTRPAGPMELTYPFEDMLIWGATAKIVFHLMEILLHPQKKR